MTMPDVTTIDLVPQTLNLRLYAGDGVTINLRFVQAGEPLPMDDGLIKAEIRTNRLDPDPLVTWTVDASEAADGLITISLSGDQTRELMEDFRKTQLWSAWKGVWDVQWQQTGTQPLTIFQGDCYCDSDVTR